MKRIIATLIGFAAGAALVNAQGLVSFNNSGSGVLTNNTPYATDYPSTVGAQANGKTANIANSYEYVLLAATTTNSSDIGNPLGSDWTVVDYNGGGVAYGTNSAFFGGTAGVGGTAGFASSLSSGVTYYMMVVGWSEVLGNWSSIQTLLSDNFLGNTTAGYLGYSNIGTIDPTSSPANGASIFGSSAAQPGQTILYAVPVPEPTTLALAGLGGMALLAFRRKKA